VPPARWARAPRRWPYHIQLVRASITLMIPIHHQWGETDFRALNVNALRPPLCTTGVVRSRVSPSVLFVILLLTLGAGLNPGRAGDVAPSEAQVKAAFLLNFPKYVEWPSANFPQGDSPIVVGLMDDEDVAGEFFKMSAGRVVDGHPIRLVRVTSIPQCRDCQVLFVGFSATRKLPEILSSLQGANVLTVGEQDEFNERGGMINLARRDRRIVLEVNLDAARQSQLKISSRLMALATVKGGKK
jgi:hypothetical protein